MNWGWKITILLGAFVIFIASMVVQSFGYNVDLVSEDYYMQELAYQERIDAKQRGLSLQKEIQLRGSSQGLYIVFPTTFNREITNGIIRFYRPENSSLDKELTLKLTQNEQLINVSDFEIGYYDVFLDFKINGEAYHITKDVFLQK